MSQLVGILNLTPDSFSGDGITEAPQQALEQISRLIEEGATVIDLGAESTRPGATTVDPLTEWRRLEFVLKPALAKWQSQGIIFSVDTRYEETAKAALACGVNWINDVSGGENPQLWRQVADYPKSSYVLMHSLGVPANPQHTLPQEADVIEIISSFFVKKLKAMEHQGLKHHQVILDPGIGFGKTANHSLQIIRRISELNILGCPLIVGHSRKSCLAGFAKSGESAAQRDGATLAASLYMHRQGVDYLRVHAVGLHQQAFKAAEYFDV